MHAKIEAEIGAAVELHGKVYALIHDHNGNVACLLDLEGIVKETYRYSEHIFNESGQRVDGSEVNNPWRYASKRMDEETGFIYFGRRYYDPEIGRWITTDPSGFADGPNLYAYLHHSPLTYHDAYGLETEEYENNDSSFVGAPEAFYTDGDDNRFESDSWNFNESAAMQSAAGLLGGFANGLMDDQDAIEKMRKTAGWLFSSSWDEKKEAWNQASRACLFNLR